MKQFQAVRATFTPRRVDDLRPGAERWVGKRGEWQACWIIEDGYPYAGDWAMAVPRSDEWRGFPAAWVPLCDLSDVERE